MTDDRRGNETADLLRETTEYVVEFLRDLPVRPVHATASLEELRAVLGGRLPENGDGAADTLRRLRRSDVGVIASAGPRYLGFVVGGSLPAALAADWLTSAWDQNAGTYAVAPSASVAEEVAGAWLVELLGLPSGTSFGFTTGCQMAHVTCLAAARHKVLARTGWDVERYGLSGAPAVRIIMGEESHATVPAALQYLGLGYDTPVRVAADAQGQVSVDELARALDVDPSPTIVILQAGNVNTGSIDALDSAIALVREKQQNAWVHVDGAFGLWAAVSPRRRELLRGYERADSWATDGHKWLNVPYDSGYAFVADAEAHRAAMAPPHAPYIAYGTEERDEFFWVTEYSRRARGFTTWAALRALGRRGVEEIVDRTCDHAQRMAERLGAEPGIRILNEVVLNQVLVRFSNDDELTRDVVKRVQADGVCWLAASTWQNRAVMRVSFSNWSTTRDDVDQAADAIVRSYRAAISARG